jgi:serine/threonine protein kinase
MPSKQLSVGSTLGRWTLKRRLGEGGNGIVWMSEDKGGRPGVMKILKSHWLEPSKNAAERDHRARRTRRFLDEIRFLQGRAGNHGIIPMLDYFLPNSPSPDLRPWLVMPLATPLTDYLTTNGRVFRRVVEIFRALASTLATLHSQGVCHRDIKPDNILILDQNPYLSDFGLVDFPGKEPNTADNEILGPLFYVAPEMRNEADEANATPADVYSLAKSFWVAATGQKYPLPGEQRLGIPALSLSAYVSDSRAPLLDRLIDRSTRHSPIERATSEEFSQELNAWYESYEVAFEPIQRVGEIARSLDSEKEQLRNTFQERQTWIECGIGLMRSAASLFVPLIDALNQFGFTDGQGRAMPSRLIEGEGNPLWDQWTWPNTLVSEDKETLWRGAAGTFTQFMGLNETALLICGIRIVVSETGTVTICAANVFTLGGEGGDCEIQWKEVRVVPAGSARTDSALNELVSKVIAEAPAAVGNYIALIKKSVLPD